MSSKIVYLSGMINWAKVQTPDTKYDVYTLDLYPDDESWVKFKEAGLQLKERDGEEGMYIKLRRPVSKIIQGEVITLEKPKVLIQPDIEQQVFEPFDGLVGNGSMGVCKVRVYETAKGPGHELLALAVTTLVEYEGVPGEGEYPF